ERITYSDGFDGFPMFSPDGKQLVWISHRNGKQPHETNVFIADWVELGNAEVKHHNDADFWLSRNNCSLIFPGSRELCTISRSFAGEIPRANASARASERYSLRNRATCTSRR